MEPEKRPAVPICRWGQHSRGKVAEGRHEAHPGDGAADDEGGRGRGNGADKTAELEYEDGGEVDKLDVEDPVHGAVHGLQGRRGQEVGGAVPALGKGVASARREGGRARKRTMSLTLWKWAVMAPRAGAMMVWSRATKKTAMHKAAMRRTRVRPVG